MKGYKVEDRLYIFPQTVDVIPEVEGVEVIYIQHENVKAWKEANSAVADKIKGYNFLTITALPKEWAGHTDDDIEPAPEPETRSLEVTDALEAIFQIFDNNAGQDIDPNAVPVGHGLQVNLKDDFTFNKEATEGTIVTAALNGDDISDQHGESAFHYVLFEMPDTDSSLVVEEWIPEPVLTTYYADFYNSLEAETPVDYAQLTNDGTVARTETIDGQEVDLTACLITASEYPELIGRTVYGNIDDMQYVGTDTKVPTYVENDGVVVNYGYAIISREPIPHPEPTYTLTLTGDDILENTYVKINNETVYNTGEWEVNENDNIIIEYTSSGTYNIVQAPTGATDIPATDDTAGGLEFTMPAEDTTVTIDYVDGSSSGAGPS